VLNRVVFRAFDTHKDPLYPQLQHKYLPFYRFSTDTLDTVHSPYCKHTNNGTCGAGGFCDQQKKQAVSFSAVVLPCHGTRSITSFYSESSTRARKAAMAIA
jgi:hypothetical protein